ncbi:hypothetical protein WN55_04781 [Dufourea novaeangliae]|uniref:Uncharacterized protein n=1 Tax=Dufourea novaeangliae TaxID=178035 RepID=A0A154P1U8_DUFNO|nr:hypothetical protein WN55_04781 [Dufourea novaeangliae]
MTTAYSLYRMAQHTDMKLTKTAHNRIQTVSKVSSLESLEFKRFNGKEGNFVDGSSERSEISVTGNKMATLSSRTSGLSVLFLVSAIFVPLGKSISRKTSLIARIRDGTAN